ncbi:MAG: MBL fold metallo-hydrolase [Proteobacteria bacterium]|nr:MAG: MBL fold metallo-hydrolase [Pseudomonadota bacterium]
MSLSEGYSFQHGDLQFTGYTLAGITTSIYFKNANTLFDVGQGLPFQMGAKRVLLTHGHLDHAAGVPYLIAQRNMQSQAQNDIYTPPSLAEPLGKIIRLWQEIDQHEYRYRLEGVAPGTLTEIDKHFAFKPFRTVHRVESQGYLIYQRKKRLKEEFRGADPEIILAARRRGEDPNELFLEPVVAFTGDTQIEFIDSDPDIAAARVLFMECTFFGEGKTVEHARRWGHLHFDELRAALPQLTNERIVLIHASVRYSNAYINKILDEALSPADRARVVLFPRAG